MRPNTQGKADPAPPEDIAAEQAVLGSMLIEQQAVETAAALLTSSDFTRREHIALFNAIKALHERGEPADLITVPAELKARAGLEPIGVEYLLTLFDRVPTAASVGYYAKLVKEKAAQRRLWGLFQRLAGDAQNPDTDLSKLLEQAQRGLDRIVERAGGGLPAAVSRAVPLAQRLEDISELWSAEVVEPPHILKDVIVEGCQTVIVAPSGLGKSASAYNVACNLGEGSDLWGLSVPKSRRVLYVDLENPKFRRQQRIKKLYKDVQPVSGRVFVLPRFEVGRDLQTLRNLCVEEGIDVVAFDTSSRCFPRENENDAAQAYASITGPLDLLKGEGIATLTLGRTGKSGNDQRGSGAVRDAVDIMLTMEVHRGDPKKRDAVLRLAYLKNRVTDSEETIYLQQIGQDQFRRLTEQEAGKPAGDEEAPTAKIACAQAITDFLAGCSQAHATYGEIIAAAKESGFAESTAKRARTQLEEEGTILRATGGGYVLSDPFAD